MTKRIKREKPFAPARLKSAREALAFARAVVKKTGLRLVKDMRKIPRGGALAKVKRWQQAHGVYMDPKNRMTFVRLDKGRKSRVLNKVEPGAVLETGVFIQRPRMKGARVRVTAKGEIRVNNPKRLNVVASLDAEVLADDPAKAIRQAIREQGVPGRRPDQVLLRVNGYEFRRGPMRVADFYLYFSDLMDRVTDPDKKNAMDAEDAAEVFSLELVYWKRGGRRVRPSSGNPFEDEEENEE